MAIAPGEVVAGRFEIRAHAGEGGMGTVYRAFDHLARTDVAVKLLRELSPNDLGRFAREAALLAELEHPGIVRYIDHGTTEDGIPYLVMEWLDGVTLGHILEVRGVSAAEAVELLRAVAGALALAHHRGIVHRDLKPDNLLFPGGDLARPVLIDFGVARRAGGQRDITRTGLMVGTPGYMAPEQARGELLDARADVFALGCVLYECATGSPPFAGASETAVWVKIILCEPVDPALAGVAPALSALIRRLLSPAPDDRPADAGEVERALASLGPVVGPPRRRIRAVVEHATTTAVVRGAPPCALLVGPGAGDLASAAGAAAACGFRLDRLADGGAVAAPLEAAAPVEAAARLAVAISDQMPGRIIAVAAGPRAIDRAATLLAECSLARALDGDAAASIVVVDPDVARSLSIPTRLVAGQHRLR